MKILTSLSLLIPAFSLLLRPHVLTVMLRPTTESSPTTHVLSILYPPTTSLLSKLIQLNLGGI